MTTDTTFFVPFASPGHDEELYHLIARDLLPSMGGTPAPDKLRRRIRSLVFVHNGRRWTAAVGQRLEGRWIGRPRRDERPLVIDRAIVMAIYPGPPTYRVVINTRPLPFDGVSEWVSPFLASTDALVEYFNESRSTESG